MSKLPRVGLGSSTVRRVVVVTHVVPYPPAAGNEHRIYKLLGWLRAAGYEIDLVMRPWTSVSRRQLEELRRLVDRLHVVPEAPPRGYHRPPAMARRLTGRTLRDWLYKHFGGRHYTKLVKPVVNRFHAPKPKAQPPPTPPPSPPAQAQAIEQSICPPWLVDEVARVCRAHPPVAVIAEYIWMTGAFAKVPPGALRIVDCHDLFSQRHHKVVGLGIQDPMAIPERDEVELLSRGEVVMAIHAGERELMRAMGVPAKIIEVGVDLDVRRPGRAGIPGRVLCVASDNHVNVQGLREFLAKAWPAIVAAAPQATLAIVGRVTKHLQPRDRSVLLLGFVDDLDQVYADAEVVVNPVEAGTGLKIKTVEALAYARPIVVWPNGADGLGGGADELPCLVANGWPDFAAGVARLLADAALREEMADRAERYVRTHFGRGQVYAELAAVLEGG